MIHSAEDLGRFTVARRVRCLPFESDPYLSPVCWSVRHPELRLTVVHKKLCAKSSVYMTRRNEDDYSKAHRVVTKQPDSVLGTVGCYQVTAKRRF